MYIVFAYDLLYCQQSGHEHSGGAHDTVDFLKLEKDQLEFSCWSASTAISERHQSDISCLASTSHPRLPILQPPGQPHWQLAPPPRRLETSPAGGLARRAS